MRHLATTGEALSLVSDKDLKPRNYLSQRDGAVALPFLHRLNVVNVYHEILLFTLVVNLGLGSVSARHFKDLRRTLACVIVRMVDERERRIA